MGTEGDTASEAPVTGDGTFQGSRSRQIHWQCWAPVRNQTPRALIVIVHGLGEHLRRYRYVVSRLVTEGYGVCALDQQGHGQSEGARGRVKLEEAVADLDQLIGLVRSRQPRPPLFLLGHGLGGAVALRYALVHQDQLDGMLLSNPVAAPRKNPASRMVKALVGVVAPWARVERIEPKWLSRDSRSVARYMTDELVIHRGIPAGTVRELARHIQTLPDAAPQITVPILLMYGTEDRIWPPDGSVMLTNRLGSEDLTTHAYEGLYHEILNEPERELVVDEILRWLYTRTGRG